MHLGQACSTQTYMVLARAKIIRQSTHPSTSAGPSHCLSVFHHPISKPDPHVNPVPTPSAIPSAGPSQSRLVLDGIPNMQLSDPPFAESGKQWQRGQARDCLGNKQDPAPFTPPPPTPLFDIIFQLSAFAPRHFSSSISISFLTNVIGPFCPTGSVWPFWKSRRPNWPRPFLLNPQSDKALSKEIIG